METLVFSIRRPIPTLQKGFFIVRNSEQFVVEYLFSRSFFSQAVEAGWKVVACGEMAAQVAMKTQ